MLRKLFCIMMSVLLIDSANAAFDGISTIYITNNSHEVMDVESIIDTNDITFEAHKNWEGGLFTLIPYETKKVLWFSRNSNLKTNYHYSFNVSAKKSAYPEDFVQIHFDLKPNSLYGSLVRTDFSLPDAEKNSLTKVGLSTYSGNFWGGQHHFYARVWTPLGNFYDNYHFVIDENDQQTFDASSPKSLSILSYNTQLLQYVANAVDDLNQPLSRANIIPDKITHYDVVILQELIDPVFRETLVKKMEEHYPYHTKVVGQDSSKLLSGGVMIFSQWPITKQAEIVYVAAGKIDAYAAKGAAYAVINKQGMNYHIFGTHLQAGDMPDKRLQMQELSDFIKSLNIPADQPVLIGGDFNTDQYNKDNIEFLLNTLSAQLAQNIGHTYSYDGIANTMSVGGNQSSPDAILYSDLHAKPETAQNKVFVLRDLPNVDMWPTFDLSDHFPVAGYFYFS